MVASRAWDDHVYKVHKITCRFFASLKNIKFIWRNNEQKTKLSHPWELTEWTPKTNVSNTACSDHRECWNTTQGEVHCCTETRLEWHSYLMFSSVNPYNSVMRLHRVLEKAELTEWTPNKKQMCSTLWLVPATQNAGIEVKSIRADT